MLQFVLWGAEKVDQIGLEFRFDKSTIEAGTDINLLRSTVRSLAFATEDCLRLGVDLGIDSLPRSSPDFWFGGPRWLGAWACHGRSIAQSQAGLWTRIDPSGAAAVVPLRSGRGTYGVRPCALRAGPNAQGLCAEGAQQRQIVYAFGVGGDAAFEAALTAFLVSGAHAISRVDRHELHLIDRDGEHTASGFNRHLRGFANVSEPLSRTRAAVEETHRKHNRDALVQADIAGKVQVTVHAENFEYSTGTYPQDMMQRLGHEFIDVLKLGFGSLPVFSALARDPGWLSKHVGQLVLFWSLGPDWGDIAAATQQLLSDSGFRAIAASANPFMMPSFWLSTGAVDVLGGSPGLHISFCGPECERRCQCRARSVA